MLFRWNERRLSSNKIRVIPAVETYVKHDQDEVHNEEFFGIGFEPHDFKINQDSSDNESLNFDLPTELEDNSSCSETEMYYASLSEEESPSSDIIETAFHRADDYTRVSEHIMQTGENIRFNPNHTALLKSSLCLLSKAKNEIEFTNTLNAYKLAALPHSNNCPFQVFSQVLRKAVLKETNDQNIQNHRLAQLLSNDGIDPTALHSLIITELYKNEKEYSRFILSPKFLFREEVMLLKEDSTHSSEIVNCIPLAICNLLQIPIVIFTGMLHIPIVPLSPVQPAYYQPVSVGYNGHFVELQKHTTNDKNEIILTLPTTSSTTDQTPCRCGRGATKSKESCKTIRCKCVGNGKSCDKCNCLNCGNIFGRKEVQENTSGKPVPRKRRRQEMSTEMKTNVEFLKESREKIPVEQWSLYEKMVLIELTRTLFGDETFNIESLCNILSNTDGYRFPHQRTITSRSRSEISKQIFHAISQDNAYQILLTEQLRINSV